MKISVSLPPDDVETLDQHMRNAGLRSRSAALHEAVRLLRQSGLEADYAAAFEEWEQSGERDAWDSVVNDGQE